MSTTQSNPDTAVIAANLEALHIRLQRAMRTVGEARLALAEKRPNQAIGTILDLERALPECDALFRTILLLHRSRETFAQQEAQP